MSEVDFDSQAASGDEGLNSDRLVPVSEAIRYRKRAQSAEKRVDELGQELATSRKKSEQLNERLKDVSFEQELVTKLTSAGAGDIEAAVLMARARMDDSAQEVGVDSVVERLIKEKGYLFEGRQAGPVAGKTAGVKDRKPSGQGVLERAAKRAATSGNRTDVQEYLRVRRQFV